MEMVMANNFSTVMIWNYPVETANKKWLFSGSRKTKSLKFNWKGHTRFYVDVFLDDFATHVIGRVFAPKSLYRTVTPHLS